MKDGKRRLMILGTILMLVSSMAVAGETSRSPVHLAPTGDPILVIVPDGIQDSPDGVDPLVRMEAPGDGYYVLIPITIDAVCQKPSWCVEREFTNGKPYQQALHDCLSCAEDLQNRGTTSPSQANAQRNACRTMYGLSTNTSWDI
jgi:hypothetical protein